MANPRKTVAHDENHARYETFKIDNSTITYDATKARGSAQVDLAVKLSTDDTVALVVADDAIYGRLEKVEADGMCSVQIGGFSKLPAGASATVAIHGRTVGALGPSSAPGYIKSASETVSGSPTQTEVQTVLKIAKSKGIIVNNDDTTAVVVDLG